MRLYPLLLADGVLGVCEAMVECLGHDVRIQQDLPLEDGGKNFYLGRCHLSSLHEENVSVSVQLFVHVLCAELHHVVSEQLKNCSGSSHELNSAASIGMKSYG